MLRNRSGFGPVLHPALLAVAIILNGLDSAGAGPADSVRIARFSGDLAGAISYTLDDGMRDQAENVVPWLDQQGIKATFWVVAGWTVETDDIAKTVAGDRYGGIGWQTLVRMQANGHEIGNHSWGHPDLTYCDSAALEGEVNKACSLITARIGVSPYAFCCPFNTWNEKVKAKIFERHFAAREFCTGMGNTMTTQGMNAVVQNAIRQKSWVVTMIHGITMGYDAFADPQQLAAHLAYVKTIRDSLWIATFGQVSRYVKERDSTLMTVTPVAAHEILVQLDCRLKAPAFSAPLTVVVPVGRVISAQARREGSTAALPLAVKSDRLLVDIVPGGAAVRITWQTPASGVVSGKPAIRTATASAGISCDAKGRVIDASKHRRGVKTRHPVAIIDAGSISDGK